MKDQCCTQPTIDTTWEKFFGTLCILYIQFWGWGLPAHLRMMVREAHRFNKVPTFYQFLAKLHFGLQFQDFLATMRLTVEKQYLFQVLCYIAGISKLNKQKQL